MQQSGRGLSFDLLMGFSAPQDWKWFRRSAAADLEQLMSLIIGTLEVESIAKGPCSQLDAWHVISKLQCAQQG